MVTIETVDEAAEAAREAAEARRRKILEAADDRMGLVEGRTSTSTSTGSTKDETAAAAADSEAAVAAVAAAPKPTPSASSRMAAMRKRRFKSKQQAAAVKKEETAATTEEAAAEKKGEAKVAAANKAKDSDDEKEDDAPPAAAVETKEKEPTKPEAAAAAVKEKEEEKTTDEQQPKKKYQGVAKMRRRMLKEKQQAKQQAEQQQQTPDDETTAATATTATSKQDAVQQVAAQKAQLLSKRRAPLLPILMHAVTVLLLFLAGLDVGLQQRSIDYYFDDGSAAPPLITVHTELAPRRQLGAVAVINRWVGKNVPPAAEDSISPNARAILADDEWQPGDDAASVVSDEHEEFADVVGPSGDAQQQSSSSNIDPLFRVDLDQITAGPGLLLWLGRGAVRVHRLNLAVFWYGPRNFFAGVADWLFSLTTSPPVLCLTAILLRQLVGKAVLGAHLPPKVEDETQHKDIMSMVKLFVSNFVLKSFPNAVQLYDVWTHVRADMYVLLCGLFVGLAYSHSSGGATVPPIEEEEQPPAVTEGISDEL